jgi:hypothetical protein
VTYHLEWRLVGRENRLLDQGEIDGDYADRASALQALNAFLLTFALSGRNDAAGHWWGRRSADADIEVQVSLRSPEMSPSCATAAPRAVPRQDPSPILVTRPAGQQRIEHDTRGLHLAGQGRYRPQGPDRPQAEPVRRMAL